MRHLGEKLVSSANILSFFFFLICVLLKNRCAQLLLEDITFRGESEGEKERGGEDAIFRGEERSEESSAEKRGKRRVVLKAASLFSRAALSHSSNGLRSRLSISVCQPQRQPCIAHCRMLSTDAVC